MNTIALSLYDAPTQRVVFLSQPRRIQPPPAYLSTNMKTKFLSRPLQLLAASVLLASAPVLIANEQITENTSPARIALLNRGPIALDFAGGTLADLSVALNNLGENACTIVGEKAHMQTPIPALSYRNAHQTAIFSSLQVLLQPKGLKLQASGTIATVFADPKNEKPEANRRMLLQSHTFPLGKLISETFKYEDIRDAIRTAWDANPENNPKDLEIRYHEKTQLLIVVGNQSGLQLASTIVGSISVKN